MSTPSQTFTSRNLAPAVMPAVFVFLWSTGFIGAKLGLPYAEPMTFLALRFGIVVALMLPFALLVRAPWPESWRAAGHIAIAGLLLHGAYLGAVFASIGLGVEAGVSALIVGVQPLLVAVAAGPLLGERITARQWTGLLLGMLGVVIVVWNKLALGIGTPFGMGLSVFALIGISAGTLYQKRFCGGMDLRSGSVIQFAATTLLVGALAFLLETREIIWHPDFIFALGWLIFVLSFGAMTLLYMLIRRGEAARVSSLFFLVPPGTAVIAWFLFGETLEVTALAGMALAMIGVALVNLRR
jgi:drug/metabolite transporter (DMT)-like permease